MNEQEVRDYMAFMTNPDNEYNCQKCPENRGETQRRLPCGQQNCWVTCHIRQEKKGGT